MVTALVTIAIFLVMISLHEFGHFFVAKLSGITVLEYAIGMGPAIFKKEAGGTLYSVRILPIGGYCKMEGEDDKSDKPGAFCNQKLWKRFLVVVAGAVLNIVLGFVIFIVFSTQNAPFATNIVDSIDRRSYMAQSGVMPGDRIVEINGRNISFYNDISLYMSEITAAETVDMTVVREGERLNFSFPMSERTGEIAYSETGMTMTTTMNGITEVEEYKYAEGAVIDPAIFGTKQAINDVKMGFSPTQEGLGVRSVIKEAYCLTKFVVKLVYKSLWDMVSGKTGLEQVSGPVGIVGAVNEAVNSPYALMQVLWMAALLTINLGVFNLLPIPALDGGRILFMLFELIRGKPVPAEKEGMVHAIGLMLLLGFALIVSAKDIWMLFK